MKNIKLRIKSAMILALILLPFLFITYFGKTPGKVIGFSFFAIISAWATYEVLSHNILKRWENILIAILTVLVWAFPLDWFSAQPEHSNFIGLAKTTGSNILIVTKQIKKSIFFGYDSLSKFRALQLLLIILFITCIFLVNLFITKTIKRDFIFSYFIAIFSTWFIPLAFKSLFIYNAANLYFVFAIIIIPVITDTMAYVGGSLFGKKLIKRGMAPKISPKKSWEGAFVGFIFGSIFVFITMYLGHITQNKTFSIFTNWKQLIAGIFLLPFISILGDLVFSLIKRLYRIKDFSNLIPGHGGFMDRFDSTSFVVIMTSIILFIN
ncbi:phosphatidate cytidylyltransferase [Mycoplasma sp. 773]